MTLERRYKLHQAMRNATLGLFGAVMTLFCLHKGLTLYQVGLFFGFYYLSVICMDLPGGIIADRLGRFKLFRFAKLFDWNAVADFGRIRAFGYAGA
jgi:hypothetical protein